MGKEHARSYNNSKLGSPLLTLPRQPYVPPQGNCLMEGHAPHVEEYSTREV